MRVYFIPALLVQKALKNESGPGEEPLDFFRIAGVDLFITARRTVEKGQSICAKRTYRKGG